MEKEEKKGFVSIPSFILSGLKEMLFSKNGNVDLSNIIEDLTLRPEHKDIVAINVALVHQGFKPKLPKVKYSPFCKFELISISMFHEAVRVKIHDYSGNKVPEEIMSIYDYLELSDEPPSNSK